MFHLGESIHLQVSPSIALNCLSLATFKGNTYTTVHDNETIELIELTGSGQISSKLIERNDPSEKVSLNKVQLVCLPKHSVGLWVVAASSNRIQVGYIETYVEQ